MLRDKSARYKCSVCGKEAVKRAHTSIWECRHCGAKFAGGAYTLTTNAGLVASRAINQSRA